MSRKVLLMGESKYIDGFMSLFDDMNAEVFLETDCVELELPISPMTQCQGGDGNLLIVCTKKTVALLEKIQRQGWEYRNNFLFAVDHIKKTALSQSLQKASDRKIAIWGGGYRGREFLEYIKDTDIEISCCIDQSPEKHGTYIASVPIVPPDELLNNPGKYFVIITMDRCGEIVNVLEEHGMKVGKDFKHYAKIDYRLPQKIEDAITEQPITAWKCQDPFRMLRLNMIGAIYCCHRPSWTRQAIGNAFEDDVDSIYSSLLYKAFCLSVINGNYVFCKENCCEMLIDSKKAAANESMFRKTDMFVSCADFDESCNLYCESCRDHRIVVKGREKDYLLEYFQKYVLRKTDILMAAGNGEVFLSSYYRKLFDELESNQVGGILLLSNGLLFDKIKTEEWSAKVDGNLGMIISVDAASPETYAKLRRGGDFTILRDRLSAIAELRRNGKIRLIALCFVVQKKNYREMMDFISLAEEFGIDAVTFIMIDNWGTYSPQEFEEISLYQNGEAKAELQAVFDEISKRKTPVRVFLNNCYGFRLFLYERLNPNAYC